MDFVVFGAPMKFLSTKISHLAVVAWQSETIHKNFITKITFLGQIQQTTKFLVLESFRLYGIL